MSFDRVASFYRTLETLAFGNALQHARTRWIDAIPGIRRALIIGEGNGRFLCELLRKHPAVEVDCVEASARMLRIAEQRVNVIFPEASGRVKFLHRDIVEWSPDGTYDLLVTHFFLDCFDAKNLTKVIARLAHAATPGATWLVADFTVPSGWWAALHARLWLRAMYTFFRLSSGLRTRELVDPTADLSTQGFACEKRELSRFGMLKSEMWRRA